LKKLPAAIFTPRRTALSTQLPKSLAENAAMADPGPTMLYQLRPLPLTFGRLELPNDEAPRAGD
jgi:hypothetical protein